MDKIQSISSIQALTSVQNAPNKSIIEQLFQEFHRAQLEQEQRQQQQVQIQIQQRNQQQQHNIQLFLQQQSNHSIPSQSIPAISPHHNVNGNGSSNNHRPLPKQNGSRNSSLASTKNRNGATKKDTATAVNPVAKETELIDLITCTLCKGYLIDATTLELCMHSFCRPCALKYIREKQRCPKCNIEIKDKRFLNRLKADTTLQNIVYKLVPGLYEKEMARRREFYALRPTSTPRYKSEMFGDIPPAKTIKPDDMLNISLTWLKDTPETEPIRTYLLCRADSTLLVLKKLIIGKFGLERPIKFYYEKSEIHFDLTALMDIAATFDWSPEKKILSLSFKEQDPDHGATDTKLERHT